MLTHSAVYSLRFILYFCSCLDCNSSSFSFCFLVPGLPFQYFISCALAMLEFLAFSICFHMLSLHFLLLRCITLIFFLLVTWFGLLSPLACSNLWRIPAFILSVAICILFSSLSSTCYFVLCSVLFLHLLHNVLTGLFFRGWVLHILLRCSLSRAFLQFAFVVLFYLLKETEHI